MRVRLLPAWIPALESSEVESFLQQRRQPAFIPVWKRGDVTQWTVELQNHGGDGRGLVVDLVGAAFKKPALDVVRGEAFFATHEAIHVASRRTLKDGFRFSFDELPLSPPSRAPKLRNPRPRSAIDKLEARVERQVRSALLPGPFLRFTCTALSAPSRVRAVPFHLATKPEGDPAGGFVLAAWFGHPDLMFTEFF
jgi:hypothetical protein